MRVVALGAVILAAVACAQATPQAPGLRLSADPGTFVLSVADVSAVFPAYSFEMLFERELDLDAVAAQYAERERAKQAFTEWKLEASLVRAFSGRSPRGSTITVSCQVDVLPDDALTRAAFVETAKEPPRTSAGQRVEPVETAPTVGDESRVYRVIPKDAPESQGLFVLIFRHVNLLNTITVSGPGAASWSFAIDLGRRQLARQLR